jgi:hypothetical protein
MTEVPPVSAVPIELTDDELDLVAGAKVDHRTRLLLVQLGQQLEL